MARSCTVEDCDSPHFGRGYCNLHYWRLVRNPKKELRIAECNWCGERKPASELRHPDASRGPTPSHCQECRTNHPQEAWCDFHGQPHARSAFTPRPDRPIGVNNFCVAASSQKASAKRALPPIACGACKSVKETWQFRGGRAKRSVCRDCEDAHSDERWCNDCKQWMARERFTSTGKGGRYLTARCVPCRTASNHGVTVQFILDRQGVSEPACGACGGYDFLKVDHDHSHCPASNGCEVCVRGYLCHACNTAEGLLRTPERARLLAEYMEFHA